MPDRAAPRTVLAVLLLVLAIAGIGAAGPRVGLHLPSRLAGLTIAALLELCLAALLLALRLGQVPPTGPARRLRSMLSALLVAGLLAIPAGAAIASLHPPRPGRRRLRQPASGTGIPQHVPRTRHAAPGLAGSPRPLIVALLAAALLAVLIVVLYRRRRAWLADRSPDPLAGDEDADAPAELARAVGSGRRVLVELDDARAAIIGCYLAMEDSLARAGAQRGIAETPDEFLARAVAAGLAGAGPAGRLTELFYEARFSTHPMPASRRHEASAALASLAAVPLVRPGAGGAGP
jgi:Domain of unknown function (DUF4129)